MNIEKKNSSLLHVFIIISYFPGRQVFRKPWLSLTLPQTPCSDSVFYDAVEAREWEHGDVRAMTDVFERILFINIQIL